MAASIRRAFTAGTVLSVAVTAAWAYTAVLTTAGPAPVPHLTGSLPADYWQIAAAPAGNGPGLFAVTAAIYTACFALAGLRSMNRRDAR